MIPIAQSDAASGLASQAHRTIDAKTTRRLIDSLDEQVDLLACREAQLDALSECIIAGDNDRMEHVLDEMTLSRQHQAQADARFKAVRDDLAALLGWAEPNVRLERLLGLIEPGARGPLRRRRAQVAELAERIRLKHRQTAVLLAECTRINRMLIDCLVGREQRVTVYGERGRKHWQGGGSLMDTER